MSVAEQRSGLNPFYRTQNNSVTSPFPRTQLVEGRPGVTFPLGRRITEHTVNEWVNAEGVTHDDSDTTRFRANGLLKVRII